jgi:hypothetical protein
MGLQSFFGTEHESVASKSYDEYQSVDSNSHNEHESVASKSLA